MDVLFESFRFDIRIHTLRDGLDLPAFQAPRRLLGGYAIRDYRGDRAYSLKEIWTSLGRVPRSQSSEDAS